MKSWDIVGWTFAAITCTSLCIVDGGRATARSQPRGGRLSLPTAFPSNTYTPHGYIDNPYHSMVFNRSGVIRSFPPLGFGWWRTDFKGNYGGGPRDHINYVSILQMSAAVDGRVYLEPSDFHSHSVEISSTYHTKHMMSYDWRDGPLVMSFRFFLPQENTLACLAEVENSGTKVKDVLIHATLLYGTGEPKWWGRDGVTARFLPEEDIGISKVWAYGDVFVLGSGVKSIAHKSTDSEAEWATWIRRSDTASTGMVTIRGRGPLRMLQSYRLNVPAKSSASALFYLSRGRNEQESVRELTTAREKALRVLEQQLAEDQAFWSRCAMLEGDWPDSWKRGWVYDFETLRMNVRRPIGIFKHPWDAMQVHSPRVVLGETSLDMMTMSYADPDLAKEVILGTFADALAPNVPCAREDGSVNMISSDGSECGTAPMWGFPFHVIQSIYLSTLDAKWMTDLYPYLKSYIEWWLKNRTDKDGWLHCNNSWESGQDGSRRFIVAEKDEGAVASFVRTVDVEASMAEAMEIMARFSVVVGKGEDQTYWRTLAAQRIRNTRQMFFDGWFRDVDGRTNTPIILPDYFDVMMLSPLTCGVATAEQVKAVQPMFLYFQNTQPRWLEWPPKLFAYAEAAWNADMRMVASDAIAQTADRVYQRIDSRDVSFRDDGDRFSYRVPGVANEFWPEREVMPGGENYGWGATLPMNILRTIIGFREKESLSPLEFFLAPSLPKTLAVRGRTLTVRNLRYRSVDLDVTYQVLDPEHIRVHLQYRSRKPVLAAVLERSGQGVLQTTVPQDRGSVSFTTEKGSVHIVKFE